MSRLQLSSPMLFEITNEIRTLQLVASTISSAPSAHLPPWLPKGDNANKASGLTLTGLLLTCSSIER